MLSPTGGTICHTDLLILVIRHRAKNTPPQQPLFHQEKQSQELEHHHPKEHDHPLAFIINWVPNHICCKLPTPQYNFHPALTRIPLNGPGYLAAAVRNYVESSLNSLHLTAQTLVKIGTGATNCYVEYVDIQIDFNSF